MATLTLNTVVVRGNCHVETEVDGQVFMMHLEQGKYFALDASAHRFWQLVVQPVILYSVVTTLTNEYQVTPAQCAMEVLAFAESLLRNGLIVATPA